MLISHKQIWGVLIIAILTALLGSSLFFFCRRKLRQRWSRKVGGAGDSERATKKFSADCLLGSGAFGNVYKGTFKVEGTLAIKIAHAESYQSVEESRNEVRLLSTVNHSNLIGLKGFCEESGPKGAKILVYEYEPHGSLLEYIMGRDLTWRQRVNIAIGAAKDMFEAKVSDFGLVKLGPIGDQSHARPSIERGSILDTSLLSEPCNMEMMLKMGELGQRCVVKMPKDSPTMTEVWQELEDTLYSVDNFMNKQPLKSSRRTIGKFPRPSEQGHRRSLDQDYSQSFVSLDGVGFQKFRVEMDSVSFQNTS